jgi:hypothetical protein
MGKTISAKLIARAVLVSSSFAAKGTFFSSYRRPAEGTRYSPFTYGQIPVGYRQNKPKDNQPPKLLEGKEYHFYAHVNSANGSGICFRIQDQKAVKCR